MMSAGFRKGNFMTKVILKAIQTAASKIFACSSGDSASKSKPCLESDTKSDSKPESKFDSAIEAPSKPSANVRSEGAKRSRRPYEYTVLRSSPDKKRRKSPYEYTVLSSSKDDKKSESPYEFPVLGDSSDHGDKSASPYEYSMLGDEKPAPLPTPEQLLDEVKGEIPDDEYIFREALRLAVSFIDQVAEQIRSGGSSSEYSIRHDGEIPWYVRIILDDILHGNGGWKLWREIAVSKLTWSAIRPMGKYLGLIPSHGALLEYIETDVRQELRARSEYPVQKLAEKAIAVVREQLVLSGLGHEYRVEFDEKLHWLVLEDLKAVLRAANWDARVEYTSLIEAEFSHPGTRLVLKKRFDGGAYKIL